jgi:hypothetical protein
MLIAIDSKIPTAGNQMLSLFTNVTVKQISNDNIDID